VAAYKKRDLHGGLGVLVMGSSLLARKYRGALVQSRISPISRSAVVLTFALAAIALLASLATKFTFASLPNIMPLVAGVAILDVLSRLLPQARFAEALQSILYGVLYLVITVLCGIIAAYAMQRFAFPLQDRLLANMDAAFGLSWADYAHWVDRHDQIQRVFRFAYDTIQIQIALPLVVLAFAQRQSEVRVYLLAFTIAFIVTIVISAVMPAAGPIGLVDPAAFGILQFTGATPLDHLMRLREAGPLIMTDPPGGIATFPSFHATVAVLTPLTLRRYPRILVALLVLNAAMLGGTVTEGAHYFVDVLAGICMAFFAHALAKRIIRVEDHSPTLLAPAAP
jgi:membrane-associated phospholipid phosphatase